MKKILISILKIGIPLALGIYLIWYFYDIMDEEEKKALFTYMKKANYWWIFLSLILGFFSHLSRAYRWKYLVEPLGKKISFWNSYHAIMIGNFINLFVPRGGEFSRAVVLSKTEKVSFSKLMGTIITERAIDVLALGVICLITIYYQYENLDLITARMEVLNDSFSRNSTSTDESIFTFTNIIYFVVGLSFLAVLSLYIFKSAFRVKINQLVKGLMEGAFSLFKSKHPISFTLHTFFIWFMYVAMFGVCFYSIPETENFPLGGILAGFVAGTIGFVIVQGGIGVYQALVGLIVTTYLFPDYSNPIHSLGLALGWLIWLSQNLMVLILGLISYLLNLKHVSIKKNEQPTENIT